MNVTALIQLLVSAIAVAAMVGVAALAARGRRPQPLDETAVRALLDDEFPGWAVDRLWIAADGFGSIARSGDRALVLAKVGDGYVARSLDWAEAADAPMSAGKVRLRFGEFGAPGAELAIANWPPQERAA